jgi:hypothetical protein
LKNNSRIQVSSKEIKNGNTVKSRNGRAAVGVRSENFSEIFRIMFHCSNNRTGRNPDVERKSENLPVFGKAVLMFSRDGTELVTGMDFCIQSNF